MKKLFGIGELATGERNILLVPRFFFFSFFFGQGGASVSTPASANNTGIDPRESMTLFMFLKLHTMHDGVML